MSDVHSIVQVDKEVIINYIKKGKRYVATGLAPWTTNGGQNENGNANTSGTSFRNPFKPYEW